MIEPTWERFCALLPKKDEDVHPLGCHRSRIPDRFIFEKLVQVLVFGCAYERISDESCSATTLRRRRYEWIDSGAMEKLRRQSAPTPGWAARSQPAFNERSFCPIGSSSHSRLLGLDPSSFDELRLLPSLRATLRKRPLPLWEKLCTPGTKD